MDIANPGGGNAGFGSPDNVLGPFTCSVTDVISLGDGGELTLTFSPSIYDGTGDDLVVFENGFPSADVILGPVSVTWGNAMLGEVTPRIAEAITSTSAPKVLLPLFQERIFLVGLSREPLPRLVEIIVTEKIEEVLTNV